jgi:membrane-bound lytic murein transglycosylase D
MKHFKILLFFFLLTVSQGWAKEKDSTEAILADDPVLAMLDSLDAAMYFEASNFSTDTHRLNILKWHKDTVPKFSDDHYKSKLSKMDAATPFKLVYNPAVRKYIDAYSVRNRKKVAQLLGLAELYFPLFEETLDKYNLPLELKYLAIVESALNPRAQSKSGAVGLWQFMYRTGKIYDLNTTSYMDERSDPYKATEAACQYFQYLYAMFGNWELVLAAYNGGPGTLNKAIRRSGGKRDYWELRPYLPVETQGYVPAFIAVNYVMKHASLHNIYPIKPDFFGYELDTVVVRQRCDLKTIAEAVQVPFSQVEFLNPTFRSTVVPATSAGISIVLPKQRVGDFLSNLSYIYEASEETTIVAHVDPPMVMEQVAVEKQYHRVKRGETLSSIASRYRCSVGEICDWNDIRGNMIKEGQNLVFHTTPATAAATIQKADSVATPRAPKVHVVQRGDTLWDIAKRNGLTVQELKELNSMGNKHSLKIGEKIKIG